MWVGWAIGVILMGGFIGLGDVSRWSDAAVIAFASGVIASLSMLPGLLGGPTFGRSESETESETLGQWSRFSAAAMVGLIIRVTGTLALFLTCRYHMASTSEMIAAMTIGWYLLLTSIEVFVLVRALPNVAQPNVAPTSGRFPTPSPVKV